MAFTPKKDAAETGKSYPKMTFRVEEAEKTFIEAAAERAGLTPGSYIRSRVLTHSTTRAVRRAPIETRQLAQLFGILGAVGAKVQKLLDSPSRLNERGDVCATITEAEKREALETFREASVAILQALGKRPAPDSGTAQSAALHSGRGP